MVEITDKKEIEAVYWHRATNWQKKKSAIILMCIWLFLLFAGLITAILIDIAYGTPFFVKPNINHAPQVMPIIYSIMGLGIWGFCVHFGTTYYKYYKEYKKECLSDIQRSSQLLQEK